MSTKILFDELKELSQTSEKFFMNVSEYRGKRVAMFDYSLTIPANFCSRAALESRGSLFEVDENDEYVAVLCRPFEKFLNLHEYDYDGNEGLFENVKRLYGVDVQGSEDIKKLPVSYAMNKEDGSIISAFDFDGELEAKSSSSLTSEYKYMGLDLITNDTHLLDKTDTLTSQGYTVNFEFESRNPKYQIVLRHEHDQMVVTGVRHNETGDYLSYQQLVDHFGNQYVAPRIDSWDWDDVETLTDAEGYVLVFECGLRLKLKSEWYVTRHKTKENFLSTGRHFWEAYINGETDDIYLMIKDSPALVEHYNYLLQKSDDLYTRITSEGKAFYDKHIDKDMKEYFVSLNAHTWSEPMAKSYASVLKAKGQQDGTERLHQLMLVRKNISELGISSW